MKCGRLLILNFLFSFLFFILLSCDDNSIVLSLAEYREETHPTTIAEHYFAKLVEQRTQGRVKIEIFSNGSLYKTYDEVLSALVKGEICFARVPCPFFKDIVPEMDVIQLPYLYRDQNHADKVLYGEIGNSILNKLTESGYGFVGLAYFDTGINSIYMKEKISTVEEVQGLKFYVRKNSVTSDMFKQFGGQVIEKKGYWQLEENLQNNLVDGAEGNWLDYLYNGFYKIAPYYVQTKHTVVPDIFIGSQQKLNKLTEQDYKIVLECAEETRKFQKEKFNICELDSEVKVREKGVEIVELSQENRESCKRIAESLYPKYAAGYEDLMKKIEETK